MKEENQPIPIANEHELAHLYLGERFNRFSVRDISQLDLDSLLTIMAKASCFSTSTRTQAEKMKAHLSHVVAYTHRYGSARCTTATPCNYQYAHGHFATTTAPVVGQNNGTHQYRECPIIETATVYVELVV